MKKQTNYGAVTRVRLSSEQRQWLEATCKPKDRRGLGVSSLIRAALDLYRQQQQAQQNA